MKKKLEITSKTNSKLTVDVNKPLKDIRIRYNQLPAFFQEKLQKIYDKSEIEAIFYRLMFDSFEIEKSTVISRFNKVFPKSLYDKLLESLERLKTGEPVQYITGITHFYNLELQIVSGVFIPRPETEEMVKLLLNDISPESGVLDLCTGTGCIALAIAHNCPDTTITGIDISEVAIETAQLNSKKLNLPVLFKQHNLFDLPSTFYRHCFDIIVCNPPYVRCSEQTAMHKNVLNYEPYNAIFVSDDNPFVFYQEIAEKAPSILSKNGIVWLEINENLAKETAKVFKSKFKSLDIFRDFKGKERFIRVTL